VSKCVKWYCSVVDGENPAQKGQHFVIVCTKRLSFMFYLHECFDFCWVNVGNCAMDPLGVFVVGMGSHG